VSGLIEITSGAGPSELSKLTFNEIKIVAEKTGDAWIAIRKAVSDSGQSGKAETSGHISKRRTLRETIK
jgi:hypothetical protein